VLLPQWYLLFLLFFSSRRRHTRSKRDWSSDVCSSDLLFLAVFQLVGQKVRGIFWLNQFIKNLSYFRDIHGYPYIFIALECCQRRDRKSTRLNSSHVSISYAVFCLKKTNTINPIPQSYH